MAKSKFIKAVKVVKEPVKTEPDITIPDPIKIEETKIEVETKQPEPIIVKETGEETQTVIGTTSAESLQKSGWQLIDCHQTPNGKEYKFRKVK
jgi:hypothetical protein